MNSKDRHIALLSAIGMMMLILDSKTALQGAANGIELCFRTLIPSLYPFFVLSILLTSALSGNSIRWLYPLCSLVGIPKGAQSLITVGALGGYPVGAQSVSLLYQQGQLSLPQATRLLAFCNNAGPAFIFGVLGPMFSAKTVPLVLWLIHIFSAFLVGVLLPGKADEFVVQSDSHKVRISDAIAQSVKTMALICGWVICIKIILAYMDVLFLTKLPLPVQIIISGLLELSNGCLRLSEIGSDDTRFLIASFLLSLGGICVTLQTAAVAKDIPLKLYFPGKILQCAISVFLSCVLSFAFSSESLRRIPFILLLLIITGIIILLIYRYSKKVVEFRQCLMYNRGNNTSEVSSCCFVKQ